MPSPLFEKNPDGLASIPDRIRGCISLVVCITSFTCANYSTDNQWVTFFMIMGVLNMCVTLGIMFKDQD